MGANDFQVACQLFSLWNFNVRFEESRQRNPQKIHSMIFPKVRMSDDYDM